MFKRSFSSSDVSYKLIEKYKHYKNDAKKIIEELENLKSNPSGNAQRIIYLSGLLELSLLNCDLLLKRMKTDNNDNMAFIL